MDSGGLFVGTAFFNSKEKTNEYGFKYDFSSKYFLKSI